MVVSPLSLQSQCCVTKPTSEWLITASRMADDSLWSVCIRGEIADPGPLFEGDLRGVWQPEKRSSQAGTGHRLRGLVVCV